MGSCSYNDHYTIICDNGSPIRKLTANDVNNLHFDEIIGRGAFSVVYNGYIGDYPIAIKIIQNVNLSRHQLKSFDIEVCNQQRASEYELAPRILGYWVCPTEHIFIMDYIRGTLFKDILDRPNIVEIFVQLIRRVVFQNQNIGIIHGDLHEDNIFVTDNQIIFIDYGFSSSYPGNDFLADELRKGNDVDDYLKDVIQCGHLLKLIMPNIDLDDTWQKIYIQFLNDYGRIPNYDEVAEIVHNILHENITIETELDEDFDDVL